MAEAKRPVMGGHMGSRIVEKPKEFKKTIKRLITYFKPYRIIFVMIFIFAILSVLFSSLAPVVLGMITDSLFKSYTAKTGVDFNYVWKMLLLLSTLYILSSVFRYFFQRRMQVYLKK